MPRRSAIAKAIEYLRRLQRLRPDDLGACDLAITDSQIAPLVALATEIIELRLRGGAQAGGDHQGERAEN